MTTEHATLDDAIELATRAHARAHGGQTDKAYRGSSAQRTPESARNRALRKPLAQRFKIQDFFFG